MAGPTAAVAVRPAVAADCEFIHELIVELAVFENELEQVGGRCPPQSSS